MAIGTHNPSSSSNSGSSRRYTSRTNSGLRNVMNASSLDSEPNDREHRNEQGRAPEQKHSTDTTSETLSAILPHIEKAEGAEQEVINTINKLISHYQGLQREWQSRLQANTSSMRNEELLKDLSPPDVVEDARGALDEVIAQAGRAKERYRKALEEARKQERNAK